MPKLTKILTSIFSITKLLLVVFTAVYAAFVMSYDNITLHHIGILCGMISFIIILDSQKLENFDAVETIKRELKISQLQSQILTELKNNNNQMLSLFTTQAEALQKMTDMAVKSKINSPGNQSSPN